MRSWSFHLLLLPSIFVGLLIPPDAQAGTNADAKIAGHLKAHTTKGTTVCTTWAELPPCNPGESHLNVQGQVGVAYDLYLMVLDGDSTAGVAGAVFGIAYNGAPQAGVDVQGWTLCGDLEFTGGPTGIAWPDSGSGNLITWDYVNNCQRTVAQGDSSGGVTAILGVLYVYAYSDDILTLTRRQYVPHPDIAVSDCSTNLSQLELPDETGSVGFGGLSGVDPCEQYMGGGQREDGSPKTKTLWSSGFDPMLPEVTFPFEMTIAPGNAVVVESQLFQEGDHLSFTYDSSKQALFVNDLLWASYAEPAVTPPQSAGESWAREFIRRFNSTTGDGSQKVQTILKSMETGVLDTTEPPKITNQQLVVRFRDIGTTIIDLRPQSSAVIDGHELATNDISSMTARLRGAQPYVLVKDSSRRLGFLGTRATEVLGLLRRAQSSTLSRADLDRARQYKILELVNTLEGNE